MEDDARYENFKNKIFQIILNLLHLSITKFMEIPPHVHKNGALGTKFDLMQRNRHTNIWNVSYREWEKRLLHILTFLTTYFFSSLPLPRFRFYSFNADLFPTESQLVLSFVLFFFWKEKKYAISGIKPITQELSPFGGFHSEIVKGIN